jgi:hypothetical protein
VGQTYGDAVQSIQATGSQAVIATRIGGRADEDKCIVTNAWVRTSVTLPGEKPKYDAVMVELRCRSRYAGFAGKLCCQPRRPTGIELPGVRYGGRCQSGGGDADHGISFLHQLLQESLRYFGGRAQ